MPFAQFGDRLNSIELAFRGSFNTAKSAGSDSHRPNRGDCFNTISPEYRNVQRSGQTGVTCRQFLVLYERTTLHSLFTVRCESPCGEMRNGGNSLHMQAIRRAANVCRKERERR